METNNYSTPLYCLARPFSFKLSQEQAKGWQKKLITFGGCSKIKHLNTRVENNLPMRSDPSTLSSLKMRSKKIQILPTVEEEAPSIKRTMNSANFLMIKKLIQTKKRFFEIIGRLVK